MAVTFSNATKAELCREEITKKCCALAECYGLLLYCKTFSPQEIKLITENRALAPGCRDFSAGPSGFR